MNEKDKESFVKMVLKERAKDLSTVQVENIVFHKPASNPLFLRYFFIIIFIL